MLGLKTDAEDLLCGLGDEETTGMVRGTHKTQSNLWKLEMRDKRNAVGISGASKKGGRCKRRRGGGTAERKKESQHTRLEKLEAVHSSEWTLKKRRKNDRRERVGLESKEEEICGVLESAKNRVMDYCHALWEVWE